MIDLPNEKLQNELTIKLKPISAEVKCPMCEFYKFMQTQKLPMQMPPAIASTKPKSKPHASSNMIPKIPVNPAFMAILNKVGAAFKKAIEIKEKIDEKKLDAKFGSLFGNGKNVTSPATTTPTTITPTSTTKK